MWTDTLQKCGHSCVGVLCNLVQLTDLTPMRSGSHALPPLSYSSRYMPASVNVSYILAYLCHAGPYLFCPDIFGKCKCVYFPAFSLTFATPAHMYSDILFIPITLLNVLISVRILSIHRRCLPKLLELNGPFKYIATFSR